jgi:hypothetical protein
VNVIDIYSLGLRVPVARVTFRMRSSGIAPAREDASWEVDRA